MTAEIVQLVTADTTPTPAPVLESLPLASAPDVMSPETLSRVLDGVAVATLAEWRTGKNRETRRGPAFQKIGGSVRYLKTDVVAWLESHRVATSEQD
ncbi:MAG: helix-turn-helix domain-containing protein [Leucobacter sp.]